jgi:uncharacterized protein YcfL
MKRIFIAIFALALTTLTIVSCSSDSESTTVEVDSALPVGALQLQNRNLTAQNGTNQRKIEIGVVKIQYTLVLTLQQS